MIIQSLSRNISSPILFQKVDELKYGDFTDIFIKDMTIGKIVNANMYAIKILFQFYEVFGILHIKHFKTRIILSKMQSIIVKKHVFAIKHIAL